MGKTSIPNLLHLPERRMPVAAAFSQASGRRKISGEKSA
jgi:hypothetical protein